MFVEQHAYTTKMRRYIIRLKEIENKFKPQVYKKYTP